MRIPYFRVSQFARLKALPSLVCESDQLTRFIILRNAGRGNDGKPVCNGLVNTLLHWYAHLAGVGAYCGEVLRV